MQDILTLPAAEMTAFTSRPITTGMRRVSSAEVAKFAPRRILLPFDLSRSSVRALRSVSQFAGRIGAAIHLLHVVRPTEQPGIEPKTNRADDHVAEAAERMLKHWVKRVAHAPARTHVTIRIGEPVDVILARAVAIRSDLIVMTSRACSGLKNELQRSSAERISRLAPCPVLTIPEKCADELAYSEDGVLSGKCQVVLMPVDFSTAAECALPIAADISAGCGARLILAHGMEADANEEQVHARLRLWAERLLEARNEPLSCGTAVWPGGHSLYAILSEALRAEASLIVLPTRAQSWAQRLRAGSVTDGILRQAPCPVLGINENV